MRKQAPVKYLYRVWREVADGGMVRTNYAGRIELDRAPRLALWWAIHINAPYVQLWVGDTDHSELPFGFSAVCVASAKNERVKT